MLVAYLSSTISLAYKYAPSGLVEGQATVARFPFLFSFRVLSLTPGRQDDESECCAVKSSSGPVAFLLLKLSSPSLVLAVVCSRRRPCVTTFTSSSLAFARSRQFENAASNHFNLSFYFRTHA